MTEQEVEWIAWLIGKIDDVENLCPENRAKVIKSKVIRQAENLLGELPANLFNRPAIILDEKE